MDVTRRIRTSPHTTRRAIPSDSSGLRLLTKLLRELVTTQRFTEYADVKAAFRMRLARLGIRYRQSEFDDAYSLIASNTPITRPAAVKPSAGISPMRVESVSRQEASAILSNLQARLGPFTIRTVSR